MQIEQLAKINLFNFIIYNLRVSLKRRREVNEEQFKRGTVIDIERVSENT